MSSEPISEPVSLSLLPRDVGFDVRTLQIPVRLELETVSVVYLDQAGREQTATGPLGDVAAELRRAGYWVALEKPDRSVCAACGRAVPDHDREILAGHNTGGELQCLPCHYAIIASDRDLECRACRPLRPVLNRAPHSDPPR